MAKLLVGSLKGLLLSLIVMRDAIPTTWRRIPSRYRLEGTKCNTCNTPFFPPRKVCPKCRRKSKIVPFVFSGKGKVYSFTEISVPPKGLERQIPYVLAIIELDEGPRVTGQIVDARYEDIKIGDRVEVVFRRLQQNDPEGIIHYGFKFRLA